MGKIERLKALKASLIECIEEYGKDGFIDMLWDCEKKINEEYDKMKAS